MKAIIMAIISMVIVAVIIVDAVTKRKYKQGVLYQN
jgi:hypothetical protein